MTEVQQAGQVQVPEAERRRGASQRRMLVILGSLAMLLAIVPFLSRALFGERHDPQLRSSFNVAADAYVGLARVLERLSYRVTQHRDSYAQLPPPAQSLLLMIDPMDAAQLADTRLGAAQQRAVRSWLEAGGHLIASWPGTPELEVIGARIALRPGDFAGTALDVALDRQWPAMARVGTGGRVGGPAGFDGVWQPVPLGLVPLVSRFVDQDEGQQPTTTAFHEPPPAGFVTLATLEEQPVLIAREIGAGTMWLVSSSLPFSNLALARQGTGSFLVELIDRASEGGRRTVVFDEYSHGLRHRRGLLWMISHTSLLYPVVGLLLVALLLGWRGGFRLGVPVPMRAVPRRAVEEFVLSLANLTMRAGRYGAAARWLLQSYRDRLLRVRGRGPGAPMPVELEPFAQQLRGAALFGEDDLIDFSHKLRTAFEAAAHSTQREMS